MSQPRALPRDTAVTAAYAVLRGARERCRSDQADYAACVHVMAGVASALELLHRGRWQPSEVVALLDATPVAGAPTGNRATTSAACSAIRHIVNESL